MNSESVNACIGKSIVSWLLNYIAYISSIVNRQSSFKIRHSSLPIAPSPRIICTDFQGQTKKTADHRKARYPQTPTRLLCLRGQRLRSGRFKSPDRPSPQKFQPTPLAYWLPERIPGSWWSVVYTRPHSPWASLVGSTITYRRRIHPAAGFRIIRLSLHFTSLSFFFQAIRQLFSPQNSCRCRWPCPDFCRKISWHKFNKRYSLISITKLNH